MATTDGFETFDLAVDLVIAPDLSRWEWKDEDEHAHARRLGIISDTEHQSVDAARAHILAMLEERTGPFAEGVTKLAARRGRAVAPQSYRFCTSTR
ncbi:MULTISPECIES: DUF402 domain-containing protein [unclassified Streptomyces]|uniref:DUF402 domain-containing protein n=1 Tax=unclassified Streptomyces TaxID=2593676 RepID=UPI0015E13640|nr:DUF402 domain-containing protein [Streptomyces sp. CB02959]